MSNLVFTLLGRSFIDRRFSLGLIVLALAAAVALYVSVQNIQRMTRASFESSISNVDLVVGARGSDIQILLNTVFGIGQTASLISDDSVAAIAKFDQIDWHAPISLGDSHRGFRVIGTTNALFQHVLPDAAQKVGFDEVLQAIIGPDVALALGYREGDGIVLQHGIAEYGAAHDDLPFRIIKILRRTGTPFDRAVFIPLQASEAIHRGWRGGQRLVKLTPEQVEKPKKKVASRPHDDEHGHNAHHDDDHEEHDAHLHGPSGIDAVFIGLTDRRMVVQMQRNVAEYEGESLMAVIPGVTLSRIWQIIGFAERGFLAINVLIIALVLLSMVAMTALSADNRRREMAILRALGAAPRTLAALMIAEALVLSLAAALLGIGFAAGFSLIAQDIMATRYGLTAGSGFHLADAYLAFYLVPAALLANLVPAIRLYRRSVNDGIMVRR